MIQNTISKYFRDFVMHNERIHSIAFVYINKKVCLIEFLLLMHTKATERFSLKFNPKFIFKPVLTH